MKNDKHVKTASYLVLGLGGIAMLLSMVVIPYMHPPLLAIAPFLIFGISIRISSVKDASVAFAIVALTIIAGCYLYWDALAFGYVFSWQVFGLVAEYIPLFQMSIALPLFAVLIF